MIPRKVKVEENNEQHLIGGNTVNSGFIVEPDYQMVGSTIVVASGVPGTPSLSGVVT